MVPNLILLFAARGFSVHPYIKNLDLAKPLAYSYKSLTCSTYASNQKNPVICQSKFESAFAFERYLATKEEEKNRLFQHFFPFKKTGFKLPVRSLVGLFSFQSIRFRFLSLSIQTRKFRGRPFMQKNFCTARSRRL